MNWWEANKNAIGDIWAAIAAVIAVGGVIWAYITRRHKTEIPIGESYLIKPFS